MENKLFFILLAVCILTHIIRLVYEILKHSQLVKAGKVSFAVIFTNMAILWGSWVLLCRYDINEINLPDAVIYSGIFMTVIGLILFITGLFTIKSLENYDGDLITGGIYSIIRHPMYTGFILWLIGFPLSFEALTSLVLAPVFIANVMFWRYLEEKELKARFKDYINYKKSTIF